MRKIILMYGSAVGVGLLVAGVIIMLTHLLRESNAVVESELREVREVRIKANSDHFTGCDGLEAEADIWAALVKRADTDIILLEASIRQAGLLETLLRAEPEELATTWKNPGVIEPEEE